MLVLSRKTGERISIGDDIQVVVLEVSHGRVKLGFEAPREVSVRRNEVPRPMYEREFELVEMGATAY